MRTDLYIGDRWGYRGDMIREGRQARLKHTRAELRNISVGGGCEEFVAPGTSEGYEGGVHFEGERGYT